MLISKTKHYSLTGSLYQSSVNLGMFCNKQANVTTATPRTFLGPCESNMKYKVVLYWWSKNNYILNYLQSLRHLSVERREGNTTVHDGWCSAQNLQSQAQEFCMFCWPLRPSLDPEGHWETMRASGHHMVRVMGVNTHSWGRIATTPPSSQKNRTLSGWVSFLHHFHHKSNVANA